MANPNWAAKRAQLYRQLRTGAAVHSRAFRVFEQKPTAPAKELFAAAASKKNLTANQKAQLLQTLQNLKKSHKVLEKTEKEHSAAKFLSSIQKVLGMKPEPTDAKNAVLTRDAFGFWLKVDEQVYNRIVLRWEELAHFPKGNHKLTLCWPIEVKDKGRIAKVYLSFTPVQKDQRMRNIAIKHERTHMQTLAAGFAKKMNDKPKTKKKARELITENLKEELTAYASSREWHGFEGATEKYLARNRQLTKTSMTKKEISEIMEIPGILRKMRKIPANELVEIIRTTPITRLKRRLEGILEHTGK